MARGYCEQCIWWDDKHPRVNYTPEVPGITHAGFCRKHKPGAYTLKGDGGFIYQIGIQPITDAHDYCAEYRAEG